MAGQERRERVNTVIGAGVLSEVGLDIGKEEDGAVSTSTSELAREGEGNAVVEC